MKISYRGENWLLVAQTSVCAFLVLNRLRIANLLTLEETNSAQAEACATKSA
jgi:hypothetical protein